MTAACDCCKLFQSECIIPKKPSISGYKVTTIPGFQDLKTGQDPESRHNRIAIPCSNTLTGLAVSHYTLTRQLVELSVSARQHCQVSFIIT